MKIAMWDFWAGIMQPRPLGKAVHCACIDGTMSGMAMQSQAKAQACTHGLWGEGAEMRTHAMVNFQGVHLLTPSKKSNWHLLP